MDFQLSEEQIAFKKMAQEFARDEIAPHASTWDKEHYFPIDTLKKAAELGLAAIYVRDDIGGSALSRVDAALIFEQLSTQCITTAAYLSIHNMVTWIIDTYANDTLRKKYGPKLATLDFLSSYCLTEPSAGSDAASLKTTARIENDHYVLNGSKAFISGGSVSDIYLVMVRTGDDTHKGISCLLVEKDTPGMSFGKYEEKLGWRNQPTTAIYFEDCKIPLGHRIGEEGEGFKIALSALNGGRINIGACSLGGALASINLAKNYMHERVQFNKKLSQFQALQFKFADMLSDFHASRLMVYQAAHALDIGHPQTPMYCAMAKRYASDLAFKICDEALQIHGGYGYLCEYPIERILRDLRVNRILEGTNEIMRTIIAKSALQEDFDIE